MTNSENTGCMFRSLSFMHSSEVCRVRECMICNEGVWEQTDEIFLQEMYETPLELEEDLAVRCEVDDCEHDGKLLSSGSVVCERGNCGICFEGKWLYE